MKKVIGIIILFITVVGAGFALDIGDYTGTYYDIFGNRISTGRPWFFINEMYGEANATNGGLESLLWENESMTYVKDSRLDFIFGNSYVINTISAGLNMQDRFTDFTLNKVYDGYRWTLASPYVTSDFLFTRDDENGEEDTKDDLLTRVIRNILYGVNVEGSFGRNSVGFTYVNRHVSEGISKGNMPSFLTYAINEITNRETPTLYLKFANTASATATPELSPAEIIYMTVKVNGTVHWAVTNEDMLDVYPSEKVTRSGGDLNWDYNLVRPSGYVVIPIPIQVGLDEVAMITNIEVIATVSGNFSLSYSFDEDDMSYVTVYDRLEYAGDYMTKADYLALSESVRREEHTYSLTSSELASVKSTYVAGELPRNIVMEQVLSAHWDVTGDIDAIDTRLTILGEYALKVLHEEKYKNGMSNGNTLIVDLYEAYTFQAIAHVWEKQVRVSFDYYYVDTDFGSERFIMDDDDGDEMDDNWTPNRYGIPLPGLYEKLYTLPNCDQNENQMPDWTEPFIDLFVGLPFLSVEADDNNNGFIDAYENDVAVDLPYDEATGGYTIEVAFRPRALPEVFKLVYHEAASMTNTAFSRAGAPSVGASGIFNNPLFNLARGLDDAIKEERKVTFTAKTRRNVAGFYDLTLFNRTSYLFVDTIPNAVYGLLDGIDNDGAGGIDDAGELLTNYADTNGRSNVFENTFFAGGELVPFKGLSFSHLVKYRAKHEEGAFGNEVAALLSLSYSFEPANIDFLHLSLVGKLEHFFVDKGMYHNARTIEGYKNTMAVLANWEVFPKTSLNVGFEMTRFGEKWGYLYYSRYSFKLEFLSTVVKRSFLAWGFAFYHYEYEKPFEYLTRNYEYFYFEIKR